MNSYENGKTYELLSVLVYFIVFPRGFSNYFASFFPNPGWIQQISFSRCPAKGAAQMAEQI